MSTDTTNPYEQACDRFEQACRELKKAQRDRDEAEAYLLKAEAEWAGATRNLRQYESQPGVALPQYREHEGTEAA